MVDKIQEYCAGGVVYTYGKVLTIKMISNNEIIFPKGHIALGETYQDTAIREVYEETGYKTKIIDTLGSLSYEFDENGKHYAKTVYYYLMELLDTTARPTPEREEGEDFVNLWLSISKAFDMLTHQGSKDLLNKALQIINLESSRPVR